MLEEGGTVRRREGGHGGLDLSMADFGNLLSALYLYCLCFYLSKAGWDERRGWRLGDDAMEMDPDGLAWLLRGGL